MTDPRRLRDDTDASDLLRAARPSRPMTRDERGRGASRVAKLASVPLAGSAVMLWMKVVAAAAGLGVAGVVAVQIAAPSPSATPMPPATVSIAAPPPRPAALPLPEPRELEPAEPEPAAVLVPDPVKPPQREALPKLPVPVPAPVPAPAPAPAQPVDALTREAQLIETARRSLAIDPATTLLRVDDHRRAFPNGQLADERELLAVDALRRLGRTDEARARGEALLRRDPSGLYGERVRSILATLP